MIKIKVKIRKERLKVKTFETKVKRLEAFSIVLRNFFEKWGKNNEFFR